MLMDLTHSGARGGARPLQSQEEQFLGTRIWMLSWGGGEIKSRDEANNCQLQNPADTVSQAVTTGASDLGLKAKPLSHLGLSSGY